MSADFSNDDKTVIHVKKKNLRIRGRLIFNTLVT